MEQYHNSSQRLVLSLSEKSIFSPIEYQASMNPENTAIIHANDLSILPNISITYAGLLRYANLVGDVLNGLQGKYCGMFMCSSPALVVAMLGILSRGYAFVPFEPEFSAERKARMHQQLQIQCFLVQESLWNNASESAWLRSLHVACVVVLDSSGAIVHVVRTPAATPTPTEHSVDGDIA